MVSPLRVIRARPRLFSSAALGLVVAAVLAVTTTCRLETRALVGWDVGVAVYLVLAFHMMAVSEVNHIRRRAAMQDEGQLAILATTIAAPLASLGAIIAELVATDRSRGGLVLAIVTIVLSWASSTPPSRCTTPTSSTAIPGPEGAGWPSRAARRRRTTGTSSTSPSSSA